jgi:FkbM family methyltransferase
MRPNEYLPASLKKLLPKKIKENYWNMIGLVQEYRDFQDSSIEQNEIVKILNKLHEEIEIGKITFLDIGARFGSHLQTPLQKSEIEVEYIGIEPGEEECKKLKEENPKSSFYPVALSQTGKTQSLNITNHKGCSSLLTPNKEFIENFPWISDWFEIEKEIEIETITLDKLCSRENINPDLIKCDTQGYEHQIFEAGSDTINQTLVLEFEAHFKQMYEDQKLFGDIDLLLRNMNYELIDLTDINRWNENSRLPIYRNNSEPYNSEIVEVDPIYRKNLQNLNEEDEKKLCALLINYGKIDYAKRIAKSSDSRTSKVVEEVL